MFWAIILRTFGVQENLKPETAGHLGGTAGRGVELPGGKRPSLGLGFRVYGVLKQGTLRM